LRRDGIGAIVPATKPAWFAEVAMSLYAAVLVVPLIVGILIAVAVLLVNGLRERREQTQWTLRDARRVDSRDHATRSAGRSSDDKGQRIAS
jgi:hypothetical protein